MWRTALRFIYSWNELRGAASRSQEFHRFYMYIFSPNPLSSFWSEEMVESKLKNICISTDLCDALRWDSFTRETSSRVQLQDLRTFKDCTCTVLVPNRNSNIFDVKSSIVFVRIFIIPSRSGFLIVLTAKIAFVSSLYLQADFASMKCSRHFFLFQTW